MNRSFSNLNILAWILILACSLQANAQAPNTVTPTPVPFPQWVPPTPRPKAKTPFAPTPTGGINIFKGEAEVWLADANARLGVGHLDPVKDKEISDYIGKLGAYLGTYSAAPARTYKFVVLDSSFEDAFSIGDGRIYITVGMLQNMNSEDELAAVLAHEIAHDAFKHSPKTVTRQLFWMKGITKVSSAAEVAEDLAKLEKAYEKNGFASTGEALLGWSRSNELHADKAGFYNMYKAGYNPEAMKNVFRGWVARAKESPDYSSMYLLNLLFGSHPPSSQRVTALKWESLWIKMPPKNEQTKSAAFDAMKLRSTQH